MSMETKKEYLNIFHNIAEQWSFKEKWISKQETDAFIKHLIHDELDEEERCFVQKYRLYDWIFQSYYTDEERQMLAAFSQMAGKRKTAIYGAGAAARILLNCGFYRRAAGVMAAKKPGTVICGKPIMSEEQILAAGISQIIVAAKVTNYAVITERIADFCEKNGILLRGLNGRNLIQWYGVRTLRINREDRAYFEQDIETLKGEIDRHRVISFDVFDTLVMRKVLYPGDIFYIVGQRAGLNGISPALFAEKRRYAEQNNEYEQNIVGIYHTLQDLLMITESERDRLMRLEIDTEMQFLVQRKEVVKLFWYALSQGKRVFLISDMYLPEAILEKFLHGLGIEGYEKLFVSCDYQCGKTSGLFRIYKEMVSGEQCLHIGDNTAADGAAFTKEGIDFFLVRSARNLLESSNLKELSGYVYSMKEQNALGLLTAHLFNSPFALRQGHGILQIKTYKEWGYVFLGMYIVAYFDWLTRQIKKNNLEKMLFSTRDGYLFYELYNWYRENVDSGLPEAVYFKTSRKLCYVASLVEEADIDFYLRYDDVYEPEELLEKRFLIEREDIKPYTGISRREYIMQHKDIIFHKSAQVREKYRSYMRGLGLCEDGEYGFFDSYCRGTVQYLLEKFVPFKLCGLYLGKIHNTFRLNKVQSFYEDKGIYLRQDDVREKRTLMEYCFSAPETNIIGMDSDGNFLYAREYRTDRDIKHMLAIQEGVKAFFVAYFGQFPPDEETFNNSLPNAVINCMDFVDLRGECCDMGTIRSIDDMVNKGYAVWKV